MSCDSIILSRKGGEKAEMEEEKEKVESRWKTPISSQRRHGAIWPRSSKVKQSQGQTEVRSLSSGQVYSRGEGNVGAI